MTKRQKQALCNAFSELFHLRIKLRCAHKRFVPNINILRKRLFCVLIHSIQLMETFIKSPFLSLFLNEQISFWHESSIQVPSIYDENFVQRFNLIKKYHRVFGKVTFETAVLTVIKKEAINSSAAKSLLFFIQRIIQLFALALLVGPVCAWNFILLKRLNPFFNCCSFI